MTVIISFLNVIFSVVLLISPSFSYAQEPELPLSDYVYPADKLDVLVFASCLHQEKEAPILESILSEKPDAFLLLGDNIYEKSGVPEKISLAYARQRERPLMSKLFDETQIHGVWDDNDYGLADGGKHYEDKEKSKQLMLSFFEVPQADPRRFREGVYYSVIYGRGNNKVQLLFLDTRWFRDDLRKADRKGDELGPYVPDTTEGIAMLGDEQWQWLERQLSEPVALRVIASSIQVIPFRHGYESWGTMPHERTRLFEMLQSAKSPVVLLSGDRHHGELSRLDFKGFELLELTSSSLNLPRPDGKEENEFRVEGEYRKENYGVLAFDWEKRVVLLSLKDIQGNALFSSQVSF